MYVIQNTKNKMFYKSKIEKNWIHCVFDIKEAKKIQSKITARTILNSFKHPENYTIVKVNKKGHVV
ncbi:MAG: hypothetical protein ACI4VE_05745 [Clostridia bacterium]